MPELVEVEAYRHLAEAALCRYIAAVGTPDPWYLKRGLAAGSLQALVGMSFCAARRRGKLLLLATQTPGGEPGPTLGLRFGMSARLIVDGRPGVEDLRYAPKSVGASRYVRFSVGFDDGGVLVVDDPRRLGGVELEPDLVALGPDASDVTVRQLRHALGSSHAPLKARLMDQSRVAGVGNLIADEVLWRAGLSPLRAAGSLDGDELRVLAYQLKAVVRRLVRRGGSHAGDLFEHRRPGGLCPLEGAPLGRVTIGGRTTWWCPAHQK